MYNSYVYISVWKGGCALIKILSENLKLILIGLITILMILAGAVVISLYFGGDVTRQLIVTSIKGSAYISRDGKKYNADLNSRLKSGDVITTDKNCTLRISIDDDKYVTVEPDSSLYIYFTDTASKGDISVNLTKGSAICQLNNELKKNASFVLKTPNSTVSVRGTVFRASFDLKSEYMGYENVMVTEVQNFDGTVTLQLYDIDKQPFDLPMILMERTGAQMLTSEKLCKYGYLNYSFDLLSLSSTTLGELIKAGTETKLAYSAEEINLAYKAVKDEQRRLETMTEASTETTESSPAVTTTVSETTATTVPVTEPEPETSSFDTLRTTQQTHEYTTYSGVKWWELTGNSNTGTDDYDDWFTEEPESSVTGSSSAIQD